jgi:acetylglutamate kinase
MKPLVIKLGGAALSNVEAARNLAESIVLLQQEGQRVVVVHGGGPMINRRLQENNISWSFHEGQRITTPEMMGVIESALGEVNQLLCDVFTEFGINVRAIKSGQQSMFQCRQMDARLGQVGEITDVDVALVTEALESGFVPVVAPIGCDKAGLSYNINADWGASCLAATLEAKALIYATDQRGILDVNGLPYQSLTLEQLRILMKKNGVTGGMLAKTRSIEKALLNGVKKVCVTHALEMTDLIKTRLGGTLCVELSRLESIMKTKEGHYAVS